MDFSIETPRLLLRPFTIMDAEEYFNMTEDQSIKQYVPYACPGSLKETKRAIQTCYAKSDFQHDFYLVIEEKSLHEIIGALIVTENFFMQNYDACYFISKRFRKKGYMHEALEAFLKNMHPFKQDIVFAIDSTNEESLNFIKKINGIYEKPVKTFCKTYSFKYFCYHIEPQTQS